MSALATPLPAALQVLDARPVRRRGLPGVRYRLRRPHPYTGHHDVDEAFSTFEALVLPPADGRRDAPAVTLLNGITKGWERSLPAAAALARAGVGAILMDTPLGGTRRPASGRPAEDLAVLVRRGVAFDVPFAQAFFDGVAADLAALFALAEAEHGLGASRRALFGVSFGCLLSSLAFGRDGLGDRLLGAIGHPDLCAMSRGLVAEFARFSGLPPVLVTTSLHLGGVAEAAARSYGGPPAVGMLQFARLLDTLGCGGRLLDALDPVQFASSVGPDRSVHFLAGADDRVAPPSDVRRSAEAFPTASVDVVPDLGHGWYPGGRPSGVPPFETACGDWLVRHLADWLD